MASTRTQKTSKSGRGWGRPKHAHGAARPAPKGRKKPTEATLPKGVISGGVLKTLRLAQLPVLGTCRLSIEEVRVVVLHRAGDLSGHVVAVPQRRPESGAGEAGHVITLRPAPGEPVPSSLHKTPTMREIKRRLSLGARAAPPIQKVKWHEETLTPTEDPSPAAVPSRGPATPAPGSSKPTTTDSLSTLCWNSAG